MTRSFARTTSLLSAAMSSLSGTAQVPVRIRFIKTRVTTTLAPTIDTNATTAPIHRNDLRIYPRILPFALKSRAPQGLDKTGSSGKTYAARDWPPTVLEQRA